MSSDEVAVAGAPWAERVAQVTRIAMRAPSTGNAQPWACHLDGHRLHVTRDDTRALHALDPTRRQSVLSQAMFVETFVVAAAGQGIDVTVEPTAVVPDDPRVATLHLTDRKASEPTELAGAIERRHTNRGAFDAPGIPTGIDEAMTGSEPGTRGFVIDDASARARVADLVGRSAALTLRRSEARRELAALMSWRREGADRGMAIESLWPGHSELDGPASSWFLDNVQAGTEAELRRTVWASTPTVFVVATRSDDPRAWLDAGRSACRLMLHAAADGLAQDVCAGPIEAMTLFPRLASELGEPGWRAQVLMRFGRPQRPELSVASGRRPVVIA